MMSGERTILEMVDPPLLRQRLGGLSEHAPCPLAPRRNSAVDAKRQRNQRVPEQNAPHLGKRQDPLDPATGFSVEELGTMPERLFDDGLPSGAMEECGLGAAGYELVPPGKIDGLQLLHPHAVCRRCVHGSFYQRNFMREPTHRWVSRTVGPPDPTESRGAPPGSGASSRRGLRSAESGSSG